MVRPGHNQRGRVQLVVESAPSSFPYQLLRDPLSDCKVKRELSIKAVSQESALLTRCWDAFSMDCDQGRITTMKAMKSHLVRYFQGFTHLSTDSACQVRKRTGQMLRGKVLREADCTANCFVIILVLNTCEPHTRIMRGSFLHPFFLLLCCA